MKLFRNMRKWACIRIKGIQIVFFSSLSYLGVGRELGQSLKRVYVVIIEEANLEQGERGSTSLSEVMPSKPISIMLILIHDDNSREWSGQRARVSWSLGLSSLRNPSTEIYLEKSQSSSCRGAISKRSGKRTNVNWVVLGGHRDSFAFLACASTSSGVHPLWLIGELIDDENIRARTLQHPDFDRRVLCLPAVWILRSAKDTLYVYLRMQRLNVEAFVVVVKHSVGSTRHHAPCARIFDVLSRVSQSSGKFAWLHRCREMIPQKMEGWMTVLPHCAGSLLPPWRWCLALPTSSFPSTPIYSRYLSMWMCCQAEVEVEVACRVDWYVDSTKWSVTCCFLYHVLWREAYPTSSCICKSRGSADVQAEPET